ncbi:MAG: redox-sensing transcriptional repressor Rex [Roseiflexaceae bacterium]|nr:redox-sensing transcriptional repressor Rex [Chloroflexaceae bacterium]MCE2851234.1 redox-sensing transcriptional repressor Rex [Chloroflexaceae bacterium]
MNRTITPPDVVVRRLPLYARSLRYLLRDGILSVSSQELGERINVTAAQIRKDLSYFGEFGKQGIGYDVERLLNQIEHILGIDRAWAVALIGAGQLGEALIRYEGFREQGIHIAAVFDANPQKVGKSVGGITITHSDEISTVLLQRNIQMAIIAVPADRAQQVANVLIKANVRAILSYAPTVIQVPDGVWVRYIDPIAILHSMTFYLSRDE